MSFLPRISLSPSHLPTCPSFAVSNRLFFLPRRPLPPCPSLAFPVPFPCLFLAFPCLFLALSLPYPCLILLRALSISHHFAYSFRSHPPRYLSPAVYLDNPAPARRRVPSPKMALRGNRHWPKQAPAEIDSPTTLLELTQKAEASTRNSLADGRNSVADTDRAREKERRRSRWSRGDWGDGVNTRLSQTRQSNVRDSQTANSQGGTPQNRISQSRMSQSRVSQSRASQARSRESRSDKAGDEGKSERRSRVRFSHRSRDRQKESKSAHASKREGEPEEADDTYRSEVRLCYFVLSKFRSPLLTFYASHICSSCFEPP
eukprot:6200740-Pleurochrysis_carterae.AAC.1